MICDIWLRYTRYNKRFGVYVCHRLVECSNRGDWSELQPSICSYMPACSFRKYQHTFIFHRSKDVTSAMLLGVQVAM